MASIWKGSIAFGLVNVPVELRKSTQEDRLSFRMLHVRDNTPIKFTRVRADDGEAVPWKEIVKGYETDDGNFIVLDEHDFEQAALEQSHTLDIVNFVDPAEIDPRFYESSYYIVPGKGGDRAYALLREAMTKTQSTGIGRMILHRRQHLVAIRPDGDALVLLLLRFAGELVPAETYQFPERARPDSDEVKIASQLIESLRAEFNPAEFADEYEENLRRIIKARSKGKGVTLPGPAEPAREPKVVDLMKRLRESLEREKRKGAAARRSAPSRSTRPKPAPARRRRRSA